MISTQNLSLSYSGVALFEDVNISFTQGNCYGVIGANGAGKSTFLKLLSKEIEPSSGSVSIQSDKRLSFLKQDHFEYDNFTVMETVIMGNEELYSIMKEKDEIYSKSDFSEEDGIRAGHLEEAFADLDGWNAESEVLILLSGLGVKKGIEDSLMKDIDASDKVKILLAQALFGKPDILLLDEPTNHLDIEAIHWLEEFIINLDSTVILVSHDRAFLNKTCTHIADIDFGKIQIFVGNYDFWYESSQIIARQINESNKKKEEKIKELQEFIDRFSANASKSKQATSRKQQLAKINIEDIKPSNRKYPFIEFKPQRALGNSVLSVENLNVSHNDQIIIKDFDFTVSKDDKIVIVSENDLAKAAFFDAISEVTKYDNATIHWGSSVVYSYFSKNFDEAFNSNKTIVEWLMDNTNEEDETYVRGFLGRMLFSGNDALKEVNVLSGGEKVRCMLSKIMLNAPNVLILDEPTNHLDMESITALNNALIKFPGAILMSSHDYEIINTTVNRVIEIKEDGTYFNFIGTYEEYIDSKRNN